MKILSLDMATKKTGYAIFDNNKLITYGLIEAKDKDTTMRIMEIYSKIQELIVDNKVECIVCEDVPVSQHSNLEVGKNLCVLQGCLLALTKMYNLQFHRLKPTEWRARIGINHTLYICKKCGTSFEDVSGIFELECSYCHNRAKTTFEKIQKNDRELLKERAVELANKLYDLDLTYVSKNNHLNQDDIAEAILIGYAYLKGIENNGK